ncbi:ImmA/IrrE family metallo-endopeptidase [Alkalihalobacillus pseudalcaliphilus]|uniref:ImmA/IrrE family metallo-endopeptidase n=1 Tax=Alkalihalobacillus pseudalcaliphilus TaxID=79884 RepID=UPI00064DE1EE|nr:ImmA/IrrE family metallo-endopeptidase [Alkalihalobacillus pseudalcaliphilus]KMK77713.1 hypothetical protein AB990_04455 [Alkalihalobacillus pseudalcaliphilus]
MQFSTIRDQICSELFQEKGILTLKDLTLENICHHFSIHIEYMNGPSKCVSDDLFALISINQNQSLYEQHYDFFHEFSHVRKHTGNQLRLNDSFVQLQEEQAEWYALYFSMPRHIFEPFVLQAQSIEQVVEAFQIPESYVKKRILTIQSERARQHDFYQWKKREDLLRKKSLQKDKLYDSTKTMLHQLAKQVGEEKLSYDIKRLL